jgi:hypothetical protein
METDMDKLILYTSLPLFSGNSIAVCIISENTEKLKIKNDFIQKK